MQLLRWVGFARYGESDPENLMRAGVLSREDRTALLAAHEYLLRLRNELHFHAGKSQDVLNKSEQLRLAEAYGYKFDGSMLPVEKFMRDYIQHTNDVRYIVAHFVNSAKSRSSVSPIARLGFQSSGRTRFSCFLERAIGDSPTV